MAILRHLRVDRPRWVARRVRETAHMRSAIISLPSPDRAPNWRKSLEETFGFQVEDLPDLRARIQLQADERDYFVAHRLCDRKSAITSATWELLRRFPRVALESPHADMAMEEVKRRAKRDTPEAALWTITCSQRSACSPSPSVLGGPALRCLHNLSRCFPLLGSHRCPLASKTRVPSAELHHADCTRP
jgi:hypothetical protein